MLLAASFGKPNKPPDNLPGVKAYKSLGKALVAIKKVSEKGDAQKTRAAFDEAAVLFSEYLELVDLPANLNDPVYK